MVDAAAVGNFTPKRFKSLLLCTISVAVGAIAMAAYTGWKPVSAPAAAGMSALNGAPATQPARTAAPPPARSGAIRAYYTDAGVTTASYHPVALGGASAPCGGPITAAPLCPGVQLRCEPAEDGVYGWKVSGVCE